MANVSNTQVNLDGSHGEGGGQILRTALTLSAITGKPFHLHSIRSGRPKPGLMRQHLTCVKAVADLCGVTLAEDVGIGCQVLDFEPKEVQNFDNFEASIGTAGSLTLLLQTLIPILLQASTETKFVLHGGTHAQYSPSIEYLNEVFLGVLRLMGGQVDLSIDRYGFHPAGGGQVSGVVHPSKLQPIELIERDGDGKVTGEVINTADIPPEVAGKEFAQVEKKIPLHDKTETLVSDTACAGNVLILRSAGTPGSVAIDTGGRNKRSEQVAKGALRHFLRFYNSPAATDEFLADQLLIPLALAGGGRFTTSRLTDHFSTNVMIIDHFIPIEVKTLQTDRFAYEVEVSTR